MPQDTPKLFISYSWSSPAHEQWVHNLATELVDAGVDVIYDKWDLKEGHDAFVFMEKMVTDPNIKKVIIVSDRIYAEKADGRSGGVGTETQIISPEMYGKEIQNKFVAVVAERDENGNEYLPIYCKSQIYIDLSNDDLYATNFEQLLRWAYDEPLYIKPKIGKKPSFLSETNPIRLGTSASYRRALDAIKNDKSYTNGAINEYFKTSAEGLEEFRISNIDDEFDEEVIKNVDQFLPYRNEAIEIFLALAQYRNTPETWKQLYRFFETLIRYMDRPEEVSKWKESDFDNFKFIIHELFLYTISSFLKYECFDAVAHLTRQHYYVERNADYGRNVMVPFTIFYNYMSSLESRNKRLNLNRLSLRADILKQRSKTSGITFGQLMQSDFILFIKYCFDELSKKTHHIWLPETLVYLGHHDKTFEIFARAQSNEYFNEMKQIFGIGDKNDLIILFNAFREERLCIPRWNFTSFNLEVLVGFDELATIS